MSLLYWTMLPWLCAAFLPPRALEAPRPLLLLADPGHTSLEQQVVQQALLVELLANPGVQLVADAPVPASLRAAAALRQAGAAQLERGWSRMRDLHPEAAAVCAAMATQKFERVATRSGDVGPLVDGLALQAAAYLHAGAPAAAGRVLAQLLTLCPEWAPEGWLYNPDMQRAVAQARRTLQALPRRKVTVVTAAKDAAVFVDGSFAGFGDVPVEMCTKLPHYLYVLPSRGEPTGTRLVVPAGDADLDADAVPAAMRVHLVPRHALPNDVASTRYASVFAAAHATDGLVEPTLPALAAAKVQDVWVLAYAQGQLRLTRFDLTSGRRHERASPAVITSLREATELAETLLAPPEADPPLPDLGAVFAGPSPAPLALVPLAP